MERIKQLNQNCQHCGTSLIGMCQADKRKYCSVSCGAKARLRKKKPDIQEKLWQHEPETFKSAMEMYWNGIGGAAIARHFNIPEGTVYSWIHDFGGQRERAEPEKVSAIYKSLKMPVKEQFRAAESTAQWHCVLRENTQDGDESFEDENVTLVCGTLHGQSANKLAAVIYESLKEDPQSGKSYAFINKGRNTISVLSWKMPVYRISKYVKVSGTFIWPHEELGRAIEVTKAEFDRLLLLEKQRKKAEGTLQTTSINLDFMRVSGYN